jgi:hypothetical protein
LERAPRLRNASLEGTALNVYNPDGTLVQVIGQQSDGTYTTTDLNGPTPPVPSTPIVSTKPAIMTVRWDGQTADGSAVPLDFAHVDVHYSTVSGFTPSDATRATAIALRNGGSATLPMAAGTYYVRLTMVSRSGVESGPSAEVTVTVKASIEFLNTDYATAVGGVDLVIPLTWVPRIGSIHVKWVGLHTPVDNWSLSGNLLTVTDLGFWRTGDRFEVAYAYDPDQPTPPPYVPPPPPTTSTVLVDYESSGWKWLQVVRTDTVDYSSTSYDDSAWATGTAPFGERTDPSQYPSWPDFNTLWNKNSKMWARRIIATTPGVDVVLRVRWDRYLRVFWNGTDLWGSLNVTVSGGESPRTIPGSLVTGSDFIAISVTDDAWTGNGTGACYFDVSVEQ